MKANQVNINKRETMTKYVYNKDSFENSIEVENYPWGFKKTNKKYWLETNKKGTRLVSSTKNPKTNEWCKAKFSTYSEVGVLTSNIKDGKNFISWTGLSGYSNDKEIVEFTRNVDVEQLPKLSQKVICFLKAKNHAWKGVKVEFVTNPTSEQSEKLKENEDKAKSYLVDAGSKAYNTCLIKNNLKGNNDTTLNN